MDSLLYLLAEPLLAYLVHSTLLIGATWLLLRVVPIRSNPLREALWTVALFGGFVTALLQTGGAIESRTWTLGLGWFAPRAASAADSAEPSAPVAPPALTAPVQPLVRAAHPRATEPAAPTGAAPADPRIASPADESPWSAVGRRWPLAWLVGAVIAAAFFARALLRQRGWLGDRVAIDDADWLARLDRLRDRIGVAGRVRLSAATGLSSPVAFGVFRPEICVPLRAFGELSPSQQDAMLAHELAHLRRGDPLRLLLAHLAETIGFIQPLNRLARRRLFEVVEQRCDAVAIDALGSGMSLAECLTEVASWWADFRGPESARAALGMAGSPLTTRVEKLLAEDEAIDADVRRRWLAPLVYLFLPTLAAFAPAVTVAAESADPITDVERPSVGRTATPHESDDAAAVRLLEGEIDLLTNEVSDLRAELTRSGLDAKFAAEIEALELRVDRLKNRRALLTAWRERLVRKAGLADLTPVDADETAESPGSR